MQPSLKLLVAVGDSDVENDCHIFEQTENDHSDDYECDHLSFVDVVLAPVEGVDQDHSEDNCAFIRYSDHLL